MVSHGHRLARVEVGDKAIFALKQNVGPAKEASDFFVALGGEGRAFQIQDGDFLR